ncbi:MAG: Fur family transcriptional regulator [Candidatus Muiribacteriota bacterium]
MKNILREYKLRKTEIRILILKLFQQNSALNANEVHNQLNQKKKVDIATVYRTLNLFVRKGLLREFANSNGISFFENNLDNNPVHPHFFCHKCNKIICLKPLKQEHLFELIDYSQNNKIENIELKIQGICKSCKN